MRSRAGTPVMAAADGLVEDVGRRGNYGNYILIRHSGRLETAYAHLAGFAPTVAAGTTVRRGEVIGYVGMTGVATGPHLYYEVIVDGRQIDPEGSGPQAGDQGLSDADRDHQLGHPRSCAPRSLLQRWTRESGAVLALPSAIPASVPPSERASQARMLGLARAGDVERGAVIDAGAQEGQADGDVHPLLDAEILDRDQTLVVILGDDDVEFALARPHEDRVAGPGPAGIDPLAPRRLDRRAGSRRCPRGRRGRSPRHGD